MAPNVAKIFGNEINRQGGIKFTLVLTAELAKSTSSGAQIYDEDAEPDVIAMEAYLRSVAIPILNRNEIRPNLKRRS